jgi:hypothetical protein
MPILKCNKVDYNFKPPTSTGNQKFTYSSMMTPLSDIRKDKKELIKTIIDDDNELLQEIITDLRKEKIEKIKNRK